MRADDVAFVGALCYRFPVLIALLQEHVDDYDGLLPHVLMGNVTQWTIQRFRVNPSDVVLREVLDFIEDAFESQRSPELISASFLENLPREGEDGDGVRALLGRALRAQLQQIG